MLTTCQECGLQVSDKAIACPHCGYPLQEVANSRKYQQRSVKHRRLPNGFGQITKLKDPALRNPFRAMVTVGKTETGRPICKLLKPVSYFKTYNEAYEALVEYGKHRDGKTTTHTLKSLYDEWFGEISAEGRSESYLSVLDCCWTRLKPLYSITLDSIKAKDIRDCIVNADASSIIKTRIKSFLSTLFDYAVSLEYADHNPAKMFKLPKAIVTEGRTTAQSHKTFAADEMEKLWKAAEEDSFMKAVVIQCYSGWRPGEMLDLNISDVDVENWTFVGGKKTAAGKNRIVPIHSKIRVFVKYFYDKAKESGSKYLFITADRGVRLTYDNYLKSFGSKMEKAGLSEGHRPHDPRKFFVTEAKRKKVDEYAIKRIVGHHIDDITESIYTERDVEWLRSEIEKM